LYDALEKSLVFVRIEGLHVVLPPDLGLDLGPRHGEGIVHGPPGAGGIGIEDERSVDAQLGGKGLLIGVRPVEAGAAPVILDGLVEQLVLGQVVLVGNGREPELVL
jgi:hypothetical protein